MSSTVSTSPASHSTGSAETAPGNPLASVADNHHVLMGSDSSSMVVLHCDERTPASSVLGVSSVSSADIGTPSSGSFQSTFDDLDFPSNHSENLLPASIDWQDDGVFVHAETTSLDASSDVATEMIADHEEAYISRMVDFLADRNDPFMLLIHPGNTRAYIEQTREEMAERIDAMMAPFQGAQGL